MSGKHPLLTEMRVPLTMGLPAGIFGSAVIRSRQSIWSSPSSALHLPFFASATTWRNPTPVEGSRRDRDAVGLEADLRHADQVEAAGDADQVFPPDGAAGQLESLAKGVGDLAHLAAKLGIGIR